MKKTFQLQQENKHPDRVIEAVKNEIRKYLKRERKKKLPEGALFWDFDCRFGKNSGDAEVVTAAGIITSLDKAHDEQLSECYIEIITKPSFKKSEKVQEEEA